MLPLSFGCPIYGVLWCSPHFLQFQLGGTEPSSPRHKNVRFCISLNTTRPTARLLHPIMSLASQSFMQTLQGDPTVRCGCSSHSEICIYSLGSLEMPSPFSTRFVGLQIPIYYCHQCERQTDGDIDPKVVRNADVGGILVENEQIHSEKSL